MFQQLAKTGKVYSYGLKQRQSQQISQPATSQDGTNQAQPTQTGPGNPPANGREWLPQSGNAMGGGLQQSAGISKALTDLSKLYSDDKLKFRGDKYQYMETEIIMFYENCEKVGLQEVDYNRGFSSMLGGRAKEYYYDRLARLRPRPTFAQMYKAIQTHFETSERKVDYQLEWMAISLQRIIDNNPNKAKLDCLEIMFTDIRKIQPGIPPALSIDQQLRDKAHQAVLGVPECNLALLNPPATWEGLCNALRSSISTEARSGKRQDQFLQYNDYTDD